VYFVEYGVNPVSSIPSALALISTNAIGASGFIDPSILIGALSLICPAIETSAGCVEAEPNAPIVPARSVMFAV